MPRLNPAFLIASAMSGDGNLKLDSPMPNDMANAVRIEFSLGPTGEILQRPYVPSHTGRRHDSVVESRTAVEWTTLAECLEHAFDHLMPEVFRLANSLPGEDRSFVKQGAASDRERLRILHDAFNLYLMAYECYAA